MNAIPESRTDRVLVWDLPVRIFHWLLVATFAGAWLTAESESWRLVHVTLGYTMAALVAFRLAWGFAGTRYARFAEFVKSPSAVLAYVKSLATRRPIHYIGHNPAGAIAIVALLILAIVVVATGYATYSELGGEWLEDAHELAANTMLGIAIVHVLGVALGSIRHRENLVGSMFTGRKDGAPADGIASARWGAALVLLALVAGVWWYQAQDGALNPPAAGSRSTESRDLDDD